MDPVSHCLTGRLLHSAAAAPPPRGRQFAFVLGSIAPDVDIVAVAAGWDRYLLLHEIGTHAIALTPAVGLAAAGVVALLRRTAVRSLWLPATVGAIGHLTLDLVSGSDIRLFWPIWNVRLAFHWLTMADLGGFALLLAGAVATRWRPRLAAIWTLILFVALLAVKEQSQQRAVAAFARAGGRMAGHPEAVNGSLWRWDLPGRAGNDVQAWRVDALTGRVVLQFTHVDESGSAAALASRSAPVVQAMLALAHTPFARIVRDGPSQFVLWSDLRHCTAGGCALAFGVELDVSHRAVRQVIRIGPVEQSRRLR
jgi:membrane-bound metal-dependent hydrolase YbcI (DUF457 family)